MTLRCSLDGCRGKCVGHSAWCRKVAAVIPVSREVLADLAATWQERAVILGAADPTPFPHIRLWRTKTGNSVDTSG